MALLSRDRYQPGPPSRHQGAVEVVASDPERLARFDREAKTLAALNHPNVAAIYGLERANGQTALVMELVEGPMLADRIAQGPILVDEALPIAKQIAEALEAAIVKFEFLARASRDSWVTIRRREQTGS